MVVISETLRLFSVIHGESACAGHSGGLHSGHWLLMNASHVTISCKSGISCPSGARYTANTSPNRSVI